MKPEATTRGDVMFWGDLFHHVTGDIYSGIASENNSFITHGISCGTQIFFDTKSEYIEGELSCFYNNVLDFVISKTKRPGFLYLGKLVATRTK